MKTETSYYKSAYGAAEVSSSRYEWRLKIVKQIYYTIVGVAIDHHDEDDYFTEVWLCGYAYNTVSVLTFAVSFFYLILKKNCDLAKDFFFCRMEPCTHRVKDGIGMPVHWRSHVLAMRSQSIWISKRERCRSGRMTC